MLPLPIENYIPKILMDNLNADGQALIDFLNTLIEALKDDSLDLYFLKIPERCPSWLLDELGYWINAGLQGQDSETTKREKIRNAVKSHKNRGTWNDDAKLRIDAITGYSAAIFVAIDSDDAILLAKESTDPDRYWMTLQDNSGTDDDWGWWLVGDYTEYVIAGNISIDCHEGINTAVLTSDQIEQIKDEIRDDVVPAYYAVYLGYINISGQFTVYLNGIIN